jgi:hypothetical protein
MVDHRRRGTGLYARWKLVVRATTPLEEYANYAKKIINIEEEIAEPQKKLKN